MRALEHRVPILVLVQARMSSQRLPGKVMKHISDRPMLQLILDRLKRANCCHGKYKNSIVVTTSDLPEDRPIANLAIDNGLMGYVGSLDDVLDRMFMAATWYTNGGTLCNTLVRVTGDCPFVDPQIVDQTVLYFSSHQYDYVYNMECPDGFDVEVFTYDALKTAHKECKDPKEREHVTMWIAKNMSAGFDCHNVTEPVPNYHLSVDTKEDLETIRMIYWLLGEDCTMAQVIDLVKYFGLVKVVPKPYIE